MIIPDTSVWADHLGRANALLARLLERQAIATHPFITGELALGNLRNPKAAVEFMSDLPQAPVAFDPEVLLMIERYQLQGSGIGYVDAHLVASVRLSDGYSLWTRDKRLKAVAERLGIAFTEPR